MTNIPQNAPRIALIIGATGGIGGEVAKALIDQGWQVRGLCRDPVSAQHRAAWVGTIEWVRGDAMIAADVLTAAQGTAIIFHGANPPGYKNWRGLALPMLGNTIAAARATGARLIFPGNVYNFGPDAGGLITETSPQHPLTRKGKIRVEMETRLRDAADVRSLIIRAGDYFGPHQPASWFRDGMVKPGKTLKSVMYPGTPAAGHAWAYLPDLATVIARLADIEANLPEQAEFNFGGHWLEHGIEIAHSIRRAAAKPELPIRPAPWWLFYLAAPFVTFFREALEMRYLWRKPLRLDNTKLTALIGPEPHTPLDTAVRATLVELGCVTA